jgi:HlyD family secretion protein
MLQDIKVGTSLMVRIPALGNETYPVEVTYIKAMGTYATWRSTKQNGQYDVRTFDVKARPLNPIRDLRPGMTAIVVREKTHTHPTIIIQK